jgi:uncharacterized protein YyaL (SSP411 family)
MISLIHCKSQNGKLKTEQHKYTNKLADESSPYLLQHAHNPVNWHPWGEEALQKAKDEDKMLIISIGYAACHWCHVMEHESFEDSLVAQIMNDNFVCIKVDREERPDVDDVYMTACHLASGGSCGWPLNAFALPDGRPVWAGTYFPKENWMNILNQFTQLYATDRQRLESSAEKITEGIQSSEELSLVESDQEFTNKKLNNIADNFISNIDFRKGGRKGSPKFPMPNNYEFLLKYYQKTGDTRAHDAVITTLDNMGDGGIYDQIGGGFSRYSVDPIWKVPHFEKMLYDNGQLISLYSHAYQLNKNPRYLEIVKQSLEFIKRELTSPEGGFYSSLDADSEGVEGKFYVWDESEIDLLFPDKEKSQAIKDYYSIDKHGNWEEKNILYISEKREKVAKKNNLSLDELQSLILEVNKVLLKERAKRIRPGLDDKILTSWNALMIEGYVDASKATGNKEYLEIALKNGRFLIENQMDKSNRLNRNFKDGKSSINGFLDDYALTINAFVSLYEATFDESWLYKSKDLAEYVLLHFFKESNSMFNYTSDLDPPLIAQKLELSDNVIPGSNSMMARNLFRLGTYLYDENYISIARQMLHNVAQTIETTAQPNFYSNWCQLYMDAIEAPYEVAIVGPDAAKLRDELSTHYIPNAFLLGGVDEGTLELLTEKLQEGDTYIYVCQNKVCKLPVQDVGNAIELME